jgi:CHAT domain-containing protein
MLALEDYLQREYTGADTRRVHAAGAFPVYEGAIANLLVRKRPEELPETFRLAEKTKSRQLAEKIQSAAYSASFGIPGSLREKEHGLNVDIAYYEKKAFIEKHETETPDDSLLNYYNEKIFDLRREREALLKTFKTQFPDYYRLRYAPQVIDMAGVQKELLKKNKQALVEYFAGDSAIYAFIVLPDTFHIYEIVLDFPLEQWVNEFRCGLFAGYLTETACDSLSKPAGQALYARRAHQLYQKLFAPVDTLLPENAEVLLVPDGPLGYLPFEALLTRPAAEDDGFYRYSYLLRKYLISYAYSATLQHEMRYRQHRQPAGKDLIAFAPAFDEKEAADSNLLATRFIDPGLQRNRLSPLRYNRAEAEAVVAIFGGQVLCGTDATEAAFRQQAGDYRILHLATHSKVNDRAGDYSFLAFQTLDDSLENEWLYNSELYNLQLNADLVVLSACETGIGELQRGEGLISLARGFSYAGAKSIVTSLWNVSDQHTRDLMTSFYTYLKEGLPKHKALRQAKLDYLDEHEGPARSPFFWAGFVPIGDTAPVTTGRDGYWTALAALGACLLAGGLLWRQIAAG